MPALNMTFVWLMSLLHSTKGCLNPATIPTWSHSKSVSRSLPVNLLQFPLNRLPDNSVGKESACKAGDPSSIPGLGRWSGEGINYPLQYPQASLVAQTVNNLPVMWETWVWSLDRENPLEKGTATHSSILARRIPWTEEPGRLQSMGSLRVRYHFQVRQRKINIIWYHLFVESLKMIQMNLFTKQK